MLLRKLRRGFPSVARDGGGARRARRNKLRGREAVRDFITALHSQLFYASPEPISTEFADGVAGLEAVSVGTHTAEFAGVPSTGALPYSMFYDISGGKIVALRAYFPITALLHQLREAASAHA